MLVCEHGLTGPASVLVSHCYIMNGVLECENGLTT